ncbi:Dehydrogenase xptC [Lachnellula suecica]|uniref:Dehydrogenase xptC n=1 Tax=Lachnellula suecica TaxID=602035 RepID=A0A8T9CFT7_9HELO|nr:Dehydrogenase xptC [Lachnellula suecica]
MEFFFSHCCLVLGLAALHFVGICHSSPVKHRDIASIKRSADAMDESYDYIIIGGGTSGLTVANRLTEDGTKTVLVIECGVLDNDDPSIIFPPWDRHIDAQAIFNLTSPPQPALDGRTQNVVGGAIVGGGSAVNGMFFDRGSAEDYDNWAKLGNPGWGFEDLLPYFRKATNFTSPIRDIEEGWNVTYDAEAYGNGPIQASFPPFLYPGIKYQWRSFLEMGVETSSRPASGDAYGLIWAPSSEDPVSRERSFARPSYYDPAKARPNYHLLIGHKVLNISFAADTFRAYGVSFQPVNDTGTVTSVKAEREVVLAAGALHSPQILQRSGVGPKSLLEKAGIEVRIDLPGVGQNFQDHPYGAMPYTWPFTSLSNAAAFLPLKTVTEAWASIIDQAKAQDPSAYLPPHYTGTLLESYKAQQALIIEGYGSKKSAIMEVPINVKATALFVLEKPLSRGSINLNPDNPYGDPIVDFQSLSNPTDVRILTEMFRYIRKWLAMPSNQQLGAVEGNASVGVSTDAEIESMLRAGVTSSFAHPSCTNAMMPESLGGVVGPDLLVHGVKGLSVVDASIMPLIPSTHLSATVYAVAEKAADLIKGRALTDV